MKQSLKYGIFLIFALLLHSAMMDVTKEIVIPDIHSYEECSVSQARPVRNAIEKIYHFYSVLSCEFCDSLPVTPDDVLLLFKSLS